MRLINADDLINIISDRINPDRHEIFNKAMQVFIETVKVMPTVDAEPVRHGKWIERKEIFDPETTEVDAIGCSVCGKSQRIYRRTPYCPNCGAKMDGE